MTQLFNKSEEKHKRLALRSNLPPAEIKMWYLLRNRQLDGFKFRRQYGIGPFVVDFYCPAVNLVIEIDGATHCTSEEKAYDRIRQSYIENKGLTVLRFTNEQVYLVEERVLRKIKKTLRYLSNAKGTSPQPSPSKGEGGSSSWIS